MIICIVSCFHSLKGIPVIRMGQRQNLCPLRLFPVYIILKRHFQRHFHRHTAGIGKETVIQIPRQPLLQFLRQPPHRFMGQPAQHHMRKLPCLPDNGLCERRMFIAMYHTPPGRNRINHPALFRIQPYPFCIHNMIRFLHGFHLFIWIPDHRNSPFSLPGTGKACPLFSCPLAL